MAWTVRKLALRHKIKASGLVICWALVAAPARSWGTADSAIHVGETLVDALHCLQTQGTRLIFSNRTVTAGMRVMAPPKGDGVEAQLISLLAPHHLGLKPIDSGGWIVVPDNSVAENSRLSAPSRLNEIVVETSRYEKERTSVSTVIDMDRSTLNALPDTDEDVARSLQQLPGAASDGISARTHVRGGRDDETVFRYDGVKLLDPFHLKNFQGLFSALDPAVSDSVNYWTGALPIEFGGSIAGIVDVVPRQPRSVAAEAGVSLLNSSMLVAAPFAGDRGSILISGRASNLADVIRLLDRHVGEPDFRDLTARATWKLNHRTELIVGALGLNDSISVFAEDLAQRARAGYRDLYTWFKMRNEWTPGLHTETLVTFANLDSSRNSMVTRLDINDGFLSQSTTSTVNALRQELSWTSAPKWNLRLGGEFAHSVSHDVLQSDAVFQPPFTPGIQPEAHVSRSTDVHTRYSTVSAYGAVRWLFAPASILEIGLRRDGQNFQKENERSQWNTRVNFRHDFGERTTMRLAWGQYSQPEDVGRLDISDGVSDLQSARRLTQTNASIEHLFANNVAVRFEAYDKHEGSAKLTYENLFSILVLTPEIEVDRLAMQSTGARMRGVEMAVQTDRKLPLSAWASYAYSTAFDRIGGVDVPRSWSQPHAAQAGMLWKRGRWELSGLVNWHSGWPYTPLLASSGIWQDPAAVSLTLGPRNSVRHGGFQSVDVRISWVKPLKYGSVDASFELKNAFNTDNECCRSYQIVKSPTGVSTLVEASRDWLRLVPLIGVRWRW